MTDDDSSPIESTVNRRRVLQATGAAGAAGLAGCPDDLVSTATTTTMGTGTPEPVRGAGVSVARGSDLDQGSQQLFFAEAGSGSIVRYDIVRSVVSTLASGTDTITGTFLYDLDAGQGGEPDDETPSGTADVWWRHRTDSRRWMDPRNGAGIALLGDANFADVQPERLPTYDYSTDHIEETDSDVVFTAGTVFAVRTNDGNYAKVEVTSHGYDLDIRYETYELSSPFTDIGTGYDRPEDVVLDSDGTTAYIVDETASGGGEVRAVKRSNMDEIGAATIASGLPAAGQLAVDESSDVGYVAAGSELVRVDLGSGSTTTVYSGLNGARGVAVDDAGEFAYVTEAGSGSSAGTISRIELALGRREELATGLETPDHLAWASVEEDGLLFPERDPANRVSVVDLPEGTVRRVVDDAARNPASVSLASASEGYICSLEFISQFDLSLDLYDPAGPRFMGIGHIPVGRISQSSDVPTAEAGYATTPTDFPHHVTDAPFGGTLSLMLNHHDAYAVDGARYYRVFVDGTKRTRTWSALKWNASTGRQESVDVPPEGDGFYPVRKPGALWYRPRLGYKLRTGGLSNGLHTITVAFYSSRSASSKITEKSVEVRIDNDGPTAKLGRILHQLSDGTDEVVNACAIVDTARNRFKFEVTAVDAQQHLRHWRLRALWGNNESDTVAEQGYTNPNGNRKWEGPRNEVRPTGSYWNAQRKRCAHTFYLKAWSRTTNGYNYIHRSAYHKSITLLLPSSSP